MTTPVPTVAPGWYPDPSSHKMLRWFDGRRWTGQRMPSTPAGPGSSPTDPVHWLLPLGRSGLAVGAGYVGLVALVAWVVGPFAVLLGVLALRDITRRETHGRGRAWFAVVVGCLATLAAAVVAVHLLAG